MRKPKSSGLAEDVIKMDGALMASLKGVRLLAERLQEGTESPEDKSRLRKILERRIVHGKAAPPMSKKDKTAPGDSRVRKIERVLFALPEGQFQIILDLAKTMARQHKGPALPKSGNGALEES